MMETITASWSQLGGGGASNQTIQIQRFRTVERDVKLRFDSMQTTLCLSSKF